MSQDFGVEELFWWEFLRCLCRGVGLQDPQSSRAPYVHRSAPIVGEKPGKLPAKPQNGVPMGSWVGTGKVLDRFLLDVRGYSLEALIAVWVVLFFSTLQVAIGAIVLEANVFVWAIQNLAGGL